VAVRREQRLRSLADDGGVVELSRNPETWEKQVLSASWGSSG
jgi:hypothetical protein